MTKSEKCIIQNKDMVWRMLDNEAFIINPNGETIHVLNKTGSFIWELCKESIAIAEIVKQLCERFDVPEDTARSDATEIIEIMLSKNILKPAEAQGCKC